MIWLILIPIWFAYHAKRDQKNPWIWALNGFLLIALSEGLCIGIGRNLISHLKNDSQLSRSLIAFAVNFTGVFSVVWYGYEKLHIGERKKKTSS